MQNSGKLSLSFFLRELTQGLEEISPVRLSRKDAVGHINRITKSRNGRLIFEEWEELLRKPLVVGHWAALYSVYSDSLVLEYLPDWSQMERSIDIRGANLRKELVDLVLSLNAGQYAIFLSNLLSRVKWAADVRITKQTRDGGVDFRGYYIYHDGGRVPLFGQAKHWKNKVGSDPIRTFIGSVVTKAKGKACMGIYGCTGGFTPDASDQIDISPFKLLKYDLGALVELMIESRVGVKGVHLESLRMDGSFWDEITS